MVTRVLPEEIVFGMDFWSLGNGKIGTFYKLLIISHLHFIEVFGMEPYIYYLL